MPTKAQRTQRVFKLYNMTENELATIAVDICYKIHTTLGPGLLEFAYQTCLLYELRLRRLKVE